MSDVWMVALRTGGVMHEIARGSVRKSVCGRFIGDLPDGRPVHGHVLERDDAVRRYQPKPCVHCSKDFARVEPNVAPSRDRVPS